MHIQWEEMFPSTTICLRQLHKFQDDMPAQSFEGAHRDNVCVCVHRGECMRVYMSVCVCTVFFFASVLC